MPTSLGTFYGLTSTSTSSLEEPLPTMLVHSFYQGNIYPVSVVDSGFTPIYSGYFNSNSEGYNNYSAVPTTYYSGGGYGYISSGSAGSYNWVQSCSNVQAEGHYRLIYPSQSLAQGGIIRPGYSNHTTSVWPYFGICIGKAGKRQRISPYILNSTIGIWRRGSYPLETLTLTTSHLTTTSEPGTTSYGMICYNERTNTLAILRNGGSNSYRLHVWKNPNINLNKEIHVQGDLNDFMLQAKAGTNGASYFYNDFSMANSGSTSYNESLYHLRLVIGDNGKVGIARFVPSNGTYSWHLTPNPSGTSPSAGPTSLISMGVSTSYGIEQGNDYGMRSNINWDNSFVAAYNVYYYYGSGMNLVLISTADPSYQLYYPFQSTSYGCQIMPIGKSDFFVRDSQYNSDSGQGLYGYVFSPRSAKDGLDIDGNVRTSGQSAGLMQFYAPIDTSYTSTNYPIMGPMNTWVRAR